MNCKIIFLDIDGTLVNSEKVITPATKNALWAAMAKGIKIVEIIISVFLYFTILFVMYLLLK